MSEPTIDATAFDALKDMAGAEFAFELVDTFIEEAPGMIRNLHESQSSHEAERFRRAAHSLKSNSMTFGALTLGAMAKALELGGIDDSTGASLDAVDAEFARVSTALTAMRDG